MTIANQRAPRIAGASTFALIDRASVTALARNPSPIGMLLRSVPDWMLHAADKWAGQDFDRQRQIEIPYREDYLPLPDPWQYLRDAPFIAAETKRVCRAAQSWLNGLRVLCRLATGFATLNTDWYQEVARAKAAGDNPRQESALAKLSEKFVLSQLIQQEVAAQDDPGVRDEAALLLKKRQAQIAHRPKAQRSKAEASRPILQAAEIERQFCLEYHLVSSWICFPSGPWPGLMFWGNKALTKWTLARLHRDPNRFPDREGRDYLKKVRQRLELIPVSEKSPVVWDVEISPIANAGLEIAGWGRNRELVFRGQVTRLS